MTVIREKYSYVPYEHRFLLKQISSSCSIGVRAARRAGSQQIVGSNPLWNPGFTDCYIFIGLLPLQNRLVENKLGSGAARGGRRSVTSENFRTVRIRLGPQFLSVIINFW